MINFVDYLEFVLILNLYLLVIEQIIDLKIKIKLSLNWINSIDNQKKKLTNLV